MLQERIEAIREELQEVESLPELKALWCHWQCEDAEAANSAACTPFVKEARRRLRGVDTSVSDEHRHILKMIDELIVASSSRQTPAKKQPSNRVYRLLKMDVSWTTKPQVHAIMQILGAHAKPGDELPESDIVRMMEENVHVLETKQGGKRIWDYYKGDHNQGLVAHGNLVKV